MCHPHQAVSLTRAGTFSAFCVPGSGNTKINNNGGGQNREGTTRPLQDKHADHHHILKSPAPLKTVTSGTCTHSSPNCVRVFGWV